MRRLLVIAYYTPPYGLSGVMRVTKLCKFLPEAGWQPLILTVKPGAYYGYDPALLSDLERARLYRTDSLDANRLLHLVRTRGQRLRPALRAGLGAGPRLLNYLLFPDSKIGWFPFASPAGRGIIDREKPAAIFATAPPFTALLLGVRLKAHGHIPLVCDFRDPWPAGFASPPSFQRAALRRVRRYTVEHADLTLAVNAGTARLVGKGVEVLDNGFDPDDFEVEPACLPGFNIVHVGNLWQNEAGVQSFVRALELVPDARLHLVGRVGATLGRQLVRHRQVVLCGTVEHRQACAMMKGASALLYVGKPEQPVGLKLYEYLGARRPVLLWGAGNVEAAGLADAAGAGLDCGIDPARLAAALDRVRREPEGFAVGDRTRFDRRRQARWLAERLERLVLRS
jgi:hypothetical protein